MSNNYDETDEIFFDDEMENDYEEEYEEEYEEGADERTFSKRKEKKKEDDVETEPFYVSEDDFEEEDFDEDDVDEEGFDDDFGDDDEFDDDHFGGEQEVSKKEANAKEASEKIDNKKEVNKSEDFKEVATDSNEDEEVEETDSEDEYENVCFVCRRPESKTGKQFKLPNNICVCDDCMHKTMDAVSQFDYQGMLGPNFNMNPSMFQMNMPNMGMTDDENGFDMEKLSKQFPNISFVNISDLQGMGGIPNKQKPKKKKKSQKPVIDLKNLKAPHEIKAN